MNNNWFWTWLYSDYYSYHDISKTWVGSKIDGQTPIDVANWWRFMDKYLIKK